MSRKKLLVIGAGESGCGAAILAKKNGFKVFITDNQGIKEKYKKVLIHFEIPFEEKGHQGSFLQSADIVIKSPGISPQVKIIQDLKQKGIQVIDEIEFATQYTNAKIIAITGSNGKTTTTALTHHILRQGGKKVGLAGNIGFSFAKSVALENYPNYVLEVSSYQLDGIEKFFHPNIAILLNITPDHLDRYEQSFSRYVASKFRITKNMQEEDFFIYNYDDEIIRNYLELHPIKPKLIPFSQNVEFQKDGAYIKEEKIIIQIGSKKRVMNMKRLALQGRHNIYNSMAASVGGYLSEIRKSSIKESLSNFNNLSHRLEFVAKIFNVDYINDSKATNVNAVWYALETQRTDLVWIVGGVDKGNDYSKIKDLVKEKVRVIICLSKETDKIYEEFHDIVEEFYLAKTMQEAVHIAHLTAEANETVLLSPACASFDLFENYEDRGNQFKEAVKNL